MARPRAAAIPQKDDASKAEKERGLKAVSVQGTAPLAMLTRMTGLLHRFRSSEYEGRSHPFIEASF